MEISKKTLEKKKTLAGAVRRLKSFPAAANPVMSKDLRGRMRDHRAFLILSTYVLFLSIVVSAVFLIFISSNQTVGSANNRQIFGKVIFGLVVWLQLITISFVAPALTAGAISAEVEHQTYDLLRVTLIHARKLVLGKFYSGLLFVLLLLFTSLPFQSLAFLFGGVTLQEAAIAILLLAATAVAFSAIGVFCSSIFPRTLVATVAAYAATIFLVFGLPVITTMVVFLFNATQSSITQLGSKSLESALVMLIWLLVAINPLSTALASEAMLLGEQGAFWYTLPLPSGSTLTLLAPWAAYTAAYLLLSLVFLVLAIRFASQGER